MHFDVLKSAQDTADMHNLKTTQLKKTLNPHFSLLMRFGVVFWTLNGRLHRIKLYVTQPHKF